MHVEVDYLETAFASPIDLHEAIFLLLVCM